MCFELSISGNMVRMLYIVKLCYLQITEISWLMKPIEIIWLALL